ncbi:hypothetical protein SCYAM73S_06679 [Streptomyces cyaneofuscatus]
MSTPRKVLVVGGGAAGNTVTILLRRAGVEVDLVEAKDDWNATAGSGITLQGNALRVLRELGVWEDVKASGFAFGSVGITSPDGTVLHVQRDLRTGGDDLPATVGMQRPRLQHILIEAVRASGATVRLGTTATIENQVAEDSGISFLAAEGRPGAVRGPAARGGQRGPRLLRRRHSGGRRRARRTAPVHGRETDLAAGHRSTPGGGYGFRFFDVDGRTIEVSAEVEVRRHRKIEEKEAIPVKLSHVVLNSPDLERTRTWYEQHLGFRLSDTLSSPHMGDVMHFMRISSQHHSMALAKGPHTSLHHISFEMRGIDEYMRGSGRVTRAGFTKIWGPGRHTARVTTRSPTSSTPTATPSSTPPNWRNSTRTRWLPHVYDFSQPEVADAVAARRTLMNMSSSLKEMAFNDPDRGSFVAPPV